MAYDGNGTFSPLAPPVFPAEGGETISSSYFNQIINDLCQGLSNALAIDGQSTPTADLSMGGKKLTALADGIADTDATTISQLNAAVASLTAAIAAATTVSAPVGSCVQYTGSTPPSGWFECNGWAISRTTWSALFAVIGTTYGAGNGTTTFNLPDMRGMFPRGWDHGKGTDPARTLGSSQAYSNAAHAHSTTDPGHIHGVTDPGHTHTVNEMELLGGGVPSGTVKDYFYPHAVTTGSSGTGISVQSHATGVTINSSGGTEARPVNLSFMYIIKA